MKRSWWIWSSLVASLVALGFFAGRPESIAATVGQELVILALVTCALFVWLGGSRKGDQQQSEGSVSLDNE
jgi:hypothetical protein